MNIIEHAEKFLGKVSYGWKEKLSSDDLQVVCFGNRPFDSVDTFLTIGLSHHELEMGEEKKVRQELTLPISGISAVEIIVSLLLFICEIVLQNHSALLRGQVIPLPVDAAKKLGFESVYCTIPVFVEDDFSTFKGSKPPTVIVWIVPIYASEASYIERNGWDEFEDLLEEKEPDLFSLGRVPVI